MTLADRIVVMKAGVLQQVGAPADVYDRPASTFVATFVGSPPMNLLRGEAADGLFRHPAAAADVAVAAAGPVILGQRPEELSLARMGDRVGVALDRTRLHLFGPEGGTRLAPPGPH
jgi:multiple sugar transport system ATP-binding protein